jgi:hypothetical protein
LSSKQSSVLAGSIFMQKNFNRAYAANRLEPTSIAGFVVLRGHAVQGGCARLAEAYN